MPLYSTLLWRSFYTLLQSYLWSFSRDTIAVSASVICVTGASTAPPLRISDPPADLAELYLLAVLETDEGGGSPVITVQSLRDRSVESRCRLDLADGSNEASLGGQSTNVRVHVSPGSGGGAFVVVTDGGAEACAIARRGTFDEGDHATGA